jgi:hypothetical protein
MQIAPRLTVRTDVEARFSGPNEDKGNKGADIPGVGWPIGCGLQTTQASKTNKFITRAGK